MRWRAKAKRIGAAILSIVFIAAWAGGCNKEEPRARDLSTPKAAALTFARAIERGDGDTARFAAMAGGIENDLLDALALSVPALRALDSAGRAKWGTAGGTLVRRSSGSSSGGNPLDTVALLIDGDVAFLDDGTRAQITTRVGSNTLYLKKIDGQWKVDVGAMIKGQDVTHMIPWLRALGSTAATVASQIQAGALASVDEAQQAMARGIFQHLQESRAARTPDTQPATMASQ